MEARDYAYIIQVLTDIVQPKEGNNVTFSTQNKAQALLNRVLTKLDEMIED